MIRILGVHIRVPKLDLQDRESFFREPLFILELNNKQGLWGPGWGERLLGRRKGICKGPEAEGQIGSCKNKQRLCSAGP